MSAQRAILYARTLPTPRPSQWMGRLLRQVRRPRPDTSPAPSRRPAGQLVPGTRKAIQLETPDRFKALGRTCDLSQPRPDVIVGTSPQFFTACSAWALSFARRLPFVFELRDLWPASITAVGAMEPNLGLHALSGLEHFLYRRATRIVAVTESFRDELVLRGIDGAKIDVVRNGVDLERYRARTRDETLAEELGVAGRFTVGYLGTHGLAHALDSVLIAAEQLRDRKDIVFLFVGDGAAKRPLEREAERRGLANVVFQDRQPKQRMPALWSICDVALVHLRNDPVFAAVIPSKMFEAMGSGRPILYAGPDGEATGILREAGAGVLVRPEDPAALAAAVVALADDNSARQRLARASEAAALRFDRREGAAHMLATLATAAGLAAPHENTPPTAAAREQSARNELRV